MVIELLAALGIAAGVVDLAPARGTVESRVRGHVRLEADDWRHVVTSTGFVELDDAIHIAVVRDPDRALSVGLRGEHHVFDARRPVEHRVLGVVVQVDESLSHRPNSLSYSSPNYTDGIRRLVRQSTPFAIVAGQR